MWMPRYNDDTHLGDVSHLHYGHDPDATELLVVRHGQTESNIAGRWQGQQEGELTEEGIRQIKLLGRSFPKVTSALFVAPVTGGNDRRGNRRPTAAPDQFR